MKKTVIYAGIMILSFVLCGCSGGAKSAGEAPSSEKLLGGWEITAHDAGELPDDAQKAFDKAKEKLTDGEYTPVSLLATQIVAGTNYCILCQMIPVVPDAKPVWALVFIYEDLEGNAQIVDPPYEIYYDRHTPWTE